MIKIIKEIFKNKVIKAGSWYTITNFLIKGVNFLTIPIFTALLSTSEYGITNIYLSWVNIVSILMGFELYTILGKARTDLKEEYDTFHSSAIFFSLTSFSVFVIFSVVFKDIFLSFTGLSPLLSYLMLAHAYGYFLQQYLINKYRFDYQYKNVSIINVFLTGLGVFLSIVLILTVFSNQPVEGKIIGQLIPIIVIGLYTIYYFLKKGKFKIKLPHWKYILLLGTPLIVHAVSRVLNNQFDRILIDRYVGASEAGIYSFVYNIGTVLQVILISFNQAWVPWFYDKMEENNRKLIRSVGKGYRDLFTFIFAGILLLSPEIMTVMAGDSSYITSTTMMIVLWILMADYFQFMYNLEVYVEIFHKRTSLVSIASVIAAIINVTLNIIFIPQYGSIAAAITTVIAFLTMFIMHYFMASVVIGDSIFGKKFHLVSIIKLVIISFVYYLGINYLWIRLIFLGIYGILEIRNIYFVYKKIVKNNN